MRPQLGFRSMQMAAVLATILGMSLWAPPSAAQEDTREGRWQLSVPITFTSGTTWDAQEGTSFKLNDDVGFGFGFGYNLTPHFTVGTDFTWISSNYTASITTDGNGDHIPDSVTTASGTLDATNFQMFGQYNILKGRVTPFLRASFGWTWVDSNIPSGPPVGGCWWDPWYGYICTSSQPTYASTDFAYGAAAGVRGEIGHAVYLEASYNVLWVDTSRAGTQSMDGARVTFGWMF